MISWSLTPRDGLILNDGRPFQAGHTSPRSLNLPHPETLAGLVTTQRGLNEEGQFTLDQEAARRLKTETQIRGPLLYSPAHEQLFVPAPLDVVWSEVTDQSGEAIAANSHRLTLSASLTSLSTPLTSLKDGHLARPEPELGRGKPISGPALWSWSTMEAWMRGERPPQTQIINRVISDKSRFIASLPHQRRAHVSIAGETRTASDGALFMTDRVVYRSDQSTLSLMFWTPNEDISDTDKVVHLGGDVRPSLLKRSALTLPSLSQDVITQIASQKGELERVVRVTLITPALFERGATPKHLLMPSSPDQVGTRHELLGWVTGRPVPISGWDMAARGPKIHRRMAPAGSTYWIRLAEGTNLTEWVNSIHLTEVSDKKSERNAGFGLCMVGAV